MFGNISTIGYLKSLDYNKDINLYKENVISEVIKETWLKDKDQIINGYKNGTARTQHGVNAEYLHTAQKNIQEQRMAHVEGRDPILTTKSPLVNGPDDLVQGNKVFQMKFYRDTNGSLTGCFEHLDKYADQYANNPNAIYVIPPEQHQQLLDIKAGIIPEGMSELQARGLRNKIARFEDIKGGPIETVIEPGTLTYEEAQLKNIENKTHDIEQQNDTIHKEEVEKIEASIEPSVKGALKNACISAGIGAGVTAAMHIYNDFQNNKNIFKGEYNTEDYKKLLKVTAQAGGKAGACGLLYYTLAAYFKKNLLAVSFASNVIKGIAALKSEYAEGKINFAKFVNLSLAVGVTAAIDSIGEAGISALVGLGLGALSASGIALPAILAVVVSMIVTLLLSSVYSKLISVCKDFVNSDIVAMKKEHSTILENISRAFQCNLARLRNEFAVFAANVDAMDNCENDYRARVNACNRLSHVYGTSEIDPDESVASLKARFLK